jgi:hypothetical protein
MTKEEFFEQCAHFDWYYSFSDDGGVYRRNRAVEDMMLSEAKKDPVKQRIFNDWSNHYFSGESFSKPKASKPELSNY